MSKNPFIGLYEKYGWQYKCDGVGDTFTEQLAFKIAGETSFLLLITYPALKFWQAVQDTISVGTKLVADQEYALRSLAQRKKELCGTIVGQTEGIIETLKGYITPARVSSKGVNDMCYGLEKEEIEIKKKLNDLVREQITGVLSYLKDWYISLYKEGTLVVGAAGAGVGGIIKTIQEYRHKLVCLFAAMWQSLWQKISQTQYACKLEDSKLPEYKF